MLLQRVTTKENIGRQVASGVIGLLIGFLVATGLRTHASSVKRNSIDKSGKNVLRARRFELLDRGNVVRAMLGRNDDGNLGLTIYDRNKRDRIILSITEPTMDDSRVRSAKTSLNLYDRKGNMEVHLTTSEDGLGELWFGCTEVVGWDRVNHYRYAELKASSSNIGSYLGLNARGGGSPFTRPDKEKARLDLIGAQNYMFWDATGKITE